MTKTSDELKPTPDSPAPSPASGRGDAEGGGEGDESPASSWEDDESRSTLVLRAAFALLAGSCLLWAQHRAGLSTHTEWPRWIWTSVFCNFILPLGIVWMFFGQGLSRLEWLKDQKHNAWSYGFDFKNWRQHLKIAGVLFIALLPFLIYFSRQSDIRNFYQEYFPTDMSTPLLLLSLIVYMFCWEWFFRGFLLFGVSQGFGWIVAVVLQAILFGAAHYGKPSIEMYSSFAGGLVLGVLCWREKSFAPAFYTHALVHIAWAMLVLKV